MRGISVAALSLLMLALPAKAAPKADSATMTIRLFSTSMFSKVLAERPPSGISKGDFIVIESTLRNAVAQFGRPKGAIVGSDMVTLTVRSPTHAYAIVESKLPGGSLRAAGRFRFGAKQAYPVTGGTGTFAHARGTGEARALDPPSGNRRLKIYRVRLP
jgi:hypothetical protein